MLAELLTIAYEFVRVVYEFCTTSRGQVFASIFWYSVDSETGIVICIREIRHNSARSSTNQCQPQLFERPSEVRVRTSCTTVLAGQKLQCSWLALGTIQTRYHSVPWLLHGLTRQNLFKIFLSIDFSFRKTRTHWAVFNFQTRLRGQNWFQMQTTNVILYSYVVNTNYASENLSRLSESLCTL